MVKHRILDIFFFSFIVLLFNQHFENFCSEKFDTLPNQECDYIKSILGENVAEEFQKTYRDLRTNQRPELINEEYIHLESRRGLYLNAINPLIKKKGGNNLDKNEKYVVSVYFLLDFIKFPDNTKKYWHFNSANDLSDCYINYYNCLYGDENGNETKKYTNFLEQSIEETSFIPDFWFYLFQSNVDVDNHVYNKNQLHNVVNWRDKLLEKYDETIKSTFFTPRKKIENFSDFTCDELFDLQEKEILSHKVCDATEPLFNFYAKFSSSKGILLLFQQELPLSLDVVKEIIKRNELQTNEIFQSIRKLHDHKKLNNNNNIFLDSIPLEFIKHNEFLFFFIVNRWITNKTKVDNTPIIQFAINIEKFDIIEKLIVAQKGIDFNKRKEPAVAEIRAIFSQGMSLIINKLDDGNVWSNLEYVQDLDSSEIDKNDLNPSALNRYKRSKHWKQIENFLEKHVKNYDTFKKNVQDRKEDIDNIIQKNNGGYTKTQKIFFSTIPIVIVGMFAIYFTNAFNCQKKIEEFIGPYIK